ncbi:MAG: DNA polymerase Y family protein [Sphingomonas sp.]
MPAERIALGRWQSGLSALPPEPDEAAPLVFTEKVKGALRIAAGDRQALALDLTPGMALADARARVPGIASLELDEAADAALLERLADGCDRYTPLVALDPPDGVLLDVTGCVHLHGGEEGLAADANRRLARLGMTVRHAFAGTPEGAHALARYGPAGPITALPIAALELGEEALCGLRRAGLATVGAVAARPMAAIAARFGEAAVISLRRILGEESKPILPRIAPPPILAERRFAEPISRTEDALAVLAKLGEDAAKMLEARQQGGRAFVATLFRTDGLTRRLVIETARPTRDPCLVLRLLRERIDTLADPLDPGFGFDMVRLAVPRVELLAAAQIALEGEEETRQEADVALLVDRLVVRLGRQRVMRLRSLDSHIPEQAQMAVPAMDGAVPAWPRRPIDGPPERPILLLDPPEPVTVIAEVPDGPPQRFRWRGRQHQVRRFEGPERIASEWWRRREGHWPGKGGLTRDYYRIEDGNGRRFWLFRHGLYRETDDPHWYIHGLFA